MRARGRGRERATGAREEATRRRAGCRWGHSTRALTALAPALCVTLGSGGETMVTVVAIGASAARGMDAMGNGEGALGAIWTTATAALGTLLTRGSWRTSATVGDVVRAARGEWGEFVFVLLVVHAAISVDTRVARGRGGDVRAFDFRAVSADDDDDSDVGVRERERGS